jgi:intein-encoded DNA endonuclease-like protein
MILIMRGKDKRPYSMKDYEKVLKLRKQGHSYNEISAIADVGRTTCIKWIKTDRKPRSNYAKRKAKKPKEDFRELDQNLAYIYGVLIGDGYLEKSDRTYRIGLNVTDEEFAETFRDALREWSGMDTNIYRRKVEHNHKTKYGDPIECETEYIETRLSSKILVNFLEEKSKFKTEQWRVPQEVKENSEIIKSLFLRGIFDSEGFSTFSGRTKRVELEMKNKTGLKEIQELLDDLKINSYLNQSSKQKIKNTYLLRSHDLDSIKKFKKKINFSIPRKRVALNNLIEEFEN